MRVTMQKNTFKYLLFSTCISLSILSLGFSNSVQAESLGEWKGSPSIDNAIIPPGGPSPTTEYRYDGLLYGNQSDPIVAGKTSNNRYGPNGAFGGDYYI